MRLTRRCSALLAFALAAACAPGPRSSAADPGSASAGTDPAIVPGAPDAAAEQPAEWQRLAARLRAKDPAARFVEATSLFLGVPYVNGPLGEGDAGGPDPDPRCDLKHADCVTFLEQSLALAVADPDDPASFPAALDAVRYRDGEVSFEARNHYMVRDWIPSNAWLVRDVTAEVGEGHLQRAERTIDRATFLREQGAEPRPGLDDAREMAVDFVPSSALGEVASRFQNGDLILWMGKADGIFVVHTGLVLRQADGGLTLRHGSSRAGKVMDESMAKYAARSSFAQGFLVLRVLPDAAMPGRGGNAG